MEALAAHGIITNATVTTAKKYMKMNSDWLEYSDESIQDYLDEHYGFNSGAIISKVSVSTLLILVLMFGVQALS